MEQNATIVLYGASLSVAAIGAAWRQSPTGMWSLWIRCPPPQLSRAPVAS